MRRSFMAAGVAASLAMCASPAIAAPAPSPGEGKRKQAPRFVRAKVGRNHPDYGLSIEEHAANKLARSGRIY